MKKHFILSFLAGLGWLSSVGAERVAPTFPEFVSFDGDGDYYFYNVEANRFLGGYNRAEILDIGVKTHVSQITDDMYSVMFVSTGKYIYRSTSSILYVNQNYYERYCLWSFESANNNNYRLMDPAGNYAGWSGNDTFVNHGYTSDVSGIVWRLIDGYAGDMYFARLRLFTALEELKDKGYYLEEFDKVYSDPESTLEELESAALRLEYSRDMTLDFSFPIWTDYKILLEPSTDGKWKVNNNDKGLIDLYNPTYEPTSLVATFVVDQDATFCFKLDDTKNEMDFKVRIDGETVRTYKSVYREKRHFFEVAPGVHKIELIADSVNGLRISEIGIEATPPINVSLLEPGSLGTEILYNVDHLKKVRKLKINGRMNDDDWAIIDMMKDSLFVLDLSETDVETIARSRFSNWPFLHNVLLPDGLKKIEGYAFNASNLYNINFPESLESIGYGAFSRTNINEAILPEKCTDLDNYVFSECMMLTRVELSDQITEIPIGMFRGCRSLETFVLPSNLIVINDNAFYSCQHATFDLPESLTTIGGGAFYENNLYGKKDSLIVPKNVAYIGGGAFQYNKYVYVELPVAYYSVTSTVNLPTNVKTLRLNCPTVVEHAKIIIDDSCRPNITLQVPSFLVNSYKLDEYWYEFGAIEGFETEEIDEWVLNSDLVLGARERLNGTPSVVINTGGSLKINGTDGMPINNLSMQSDPDNNAYGRMFSNADKVTVNGDLLIRFRAGSANKWYFLSLPYNVKVSDIVFTNNNPKHAIRYYDGANRAANGANGSWKNFEEDDIIPAGTGFIFQVSEAGWWKIPAQGDESKAYLTSNKMFVKALAANESANASDKGWNLVGNPYQSWYNIHKLNFTAPITVRENNNYAAYSVIDDDYAIAPNQAFFVQCPEGITDISFPLDGRQMTSVIESQTGAKPRTADADGAGMRVLTDITVSNGVNTDRTRVVFNESASAEYEINCDASKFMSESADVPQIYSYDEDGIKYAINERPQGNGVVLLGFVAGESGYFTISLTRNMAEKVLLLDKENDVTVDLASQDYGFMSDAGTFENRFELVLRGETTGIDETLNADCVTVVPVKGGIDVSGVNGTVEVYSVSGVKVAGCESDGTDRFFSLPKGGYVVKAGGHSVKVVVM